MSIDLRIIGECQTRNPPHRGSPLRQRLPKEGAATPCLTHLSAAQLIPEKRATYAGSAAPMARHVRGAKLFDMQWFPIPEFRSKPRPQPPNRHLLAVDVDSIPGIRFAAQSILAD